MRALQASGWALPVAASRSTRAGDPGQPPAISLDATDADGLRAALTGMDAVVNCVAGSAETIVRSARALAGTVTGMQNPPHVVHLSSVAVYGDAAGLVAEDAPLSGALGAYGAAKIEAERLLQTCPSIVILRPGIVYGPGSEQWSIRVARWLAARRLGDLGRHGDGICNLLHVDDAAEAIVRSSQLRGAHRVLNLAQADPPTWNEYFSRYARALGFVPVARVTARRLRFETKLLAPPLKIAQLVVQRFSPAASRAIPDPVSPSLGRLFQQEITLRVEAAQQVLGLRWTPLAEGLRNTAEWYRSARAG
jgi:nucleoside-diphosphate-sugar epimerase